MNETTINCVFEKSQCILSETGDRVNYFKIAGLWHANNNSQCHKIDKVYPLDNVKSNTNTMKNTPSELNSVISNKVTVSGGNMIQLIIYSEKLSVKHSN